MQTLSARYLTSQVHFYIDAAARDRRTARNPPVAGSAAKAQHRLELIERSRRMLDRAKAYRAQLAG